MPEVEQQQDIAPESAVLESETPVTPEAPVAADTTEQVQETDEQKNERELAERQKRSEASQRGIKKRIDELTADKYAEREARQQAELARQRAERELDEWRRVIQGQQQPQQDREPQRSDFTEYEDWVAAVAVHRTQKAIEARLAARERAAAEQYARQQQTHQFTQIRTQFDGRQQAFAKEHPEYFDAVNTEDVRVPETSAAYIQVMEDGPAVILHLAKNPEIARSLWGKAPHEQALALGRISAKLGSPPQVSNAPPPGKPVGAKAGDASNPPQDMEGYLRWAAKQGLK